MQDEADGETNEYDSKTIFDKNKVLLYVYFQKVTCSIPYILFDYLFLSSLRHRLYYREKHLYTLFGRSHIGIAENGNLGYLFLSNMDASLKGNYKNFAKVKEKVAKGVAQLLETQLIGIKVF